MFDRREALPERNDSRYVVVKCTSILYGSEFALLQFIHGAGTAALGWCLPVTQFLDSGLAWCPLTSEFRYTGLKQATQANRLNLRNASKYAVFR